MQCYFPIVTEPIDRACNVIDPIDSVSNVTDPTDRACNSGDIGRLLQEEAEAKAAKRLKGSLKNPAAFRFFMFSEAFAPLPKNIAAFKKMHAAAIVQMTPLVCFLKSIHPNI